MGDLNNNIYKSISRKLYIIKQNDENLIIQKSLSTNEGSSDITQVNNFKNYFFQGNNRKKSTLNNWIYGIRYVQL